MEKYATTKLSEELQIFNDNLNHLNEAKAEYNMLKTQLTETLNKQVK